MLITVFSHILYLCNHHMVLMYSVRSPCTQEFITSYEKMKKQAILSIQASPADAEMHVLEPKVCLCT